MAQEAKSWDPGSIPGRDTSFDVPESSCLLSGPGLQLDSRYIPPRFFQAYQVYWWVPIQCGAHNVFGTLRRCEQHSRTPLTQRRSFYLWHLESYVLQLSRFLVTIQLSTLQSRCCYLRNVHLKKRQGCCSCSRRSNQYGSGRASSWGGSAANVGCGAHVQYHQAHDQQCV